MTGRQRYAGSLHPPRDAGAPAKESLRILFSQ